MDKVENNLFSPSLNMDNLHFDTIYFQTRPQRKKS